MPESLRSRLKTRRRRKKGGGIADRWKPESNADTTKTLKKHDSIMNLKGTNRLQAFKEKLAKDKAEKEAEKLKALEEAAANTKKMTGIETPKAGEYVPKTGIAKDENTVGKLNMAEQEKFLTFKEWKAGSSNVGKLSDEQLKLRYKEFVKKQNEVGKLNRVMKQEEYKPTLRDVGRLKFGKEKPKAMELLDPKIRFPKEKMAPKKRRRHRNPKVKKYATVGKKTSDEHAFDEVHDIEEDIFNILGITVYQCEQHISGFQFTWENFEGQPLYGELFKGHEGPTTHETWEVPKGEFVVQIEIWMDEFVEKMKLETQKGTIKEFGDARENVESFMVDCDVGEMFIGFHGGVGEHLNRIGCYTRTLPPDLEDPMMKEILKPPVKMPVVGTVREGARAFDFMPMFNGYGRLSGLSIAFDEVVAGLQSFYEDVTRREFEGPLYLVNRPGGLSLATFKFSPGIEIVEAEIFARGNSVVGLKILTSDYKTRIYGDVVHAEGKLFTAPYGRCICAFYGTIDHTLESLGCYIATHPLVIGKAARVPLVPAKEDHGMDAEAYVEALGERPKKLDAVGSETRAAKGTSFEDMGLYGQAHHFHKLTVFCGNDVLYGLKSEYKNANGDIFESDLHYLDQPNTCIADIEFGLGTFVTEVTICVDGDVIRGMSVKTSDGGERVFGSMENGALTKQKCVPGRAFVAFHGTYDKDGLCTLGVFDGHI